MICYGKKKILMIFSNSPSISFVIILVKVGTKKIRNCMLTGQYEYSTMYM